MQDTEEEQDETDEGCQPEEDDRKSGTVASDTQHLFPRGETMQACQLMGNSVRGEAGRHLKEPIPLPNSTKVMVGPDMPSRRHDGQRPDDQEKVRRDREPAVSRKVRARATETSIRRDREPFASRMRCG